MNSHSAGDEGGKSHLKKQAPKQGGKSLYSTKEVAKGTSPDTRERRPRVTGEHFEDDQEEPIGERNHLVD